MKTTKYFDSSATRALTESVKANISTLGPNVIVTITSETETTKVCSMYTDTYIDSDACPPQSGVTTYHGMDTVNHYSLVDLERHVRAGDSRVANLLEDMRLDLIHNDGLKALLAMFSDPEITVSGNQSFMSDIINLEYVTGNNGLYTSNGAVRMQGPLLSSEFEEAFNKSKGLQGKLWIAFPSDIDGTVAIAEDREEYLLDNLINVKPTAMSLCSYRVVTIAKMCEMMSTADKVDLIKELNSLPEITYFLRKVSWELRKSIANPSSIKAK